jgi:hypothetical protein
MYKMTDHLGCVFFPRDDIGILYNSENEKLYVVSFLLKISEEKERKNSHQKIKMQIRSVNLPDLNMHLILATYIIIS